MKLISKKVHERLMKSCERAVKKNADKLLTEVVPVSVRVLRELKMTVTKEQEEALARIEKMPAGRGVSRDVVANVKLADYYEKLKSYKPDADPVVNS